MILQAEIPSGLTVLELTMCICTQLWRWLGYSARVYIWTGLYDSQIHVL